MISVLVQSILLASSGILSLGSITLVILLLISDRGWHNGLAYMLGYFSAYSLIGVAVASAGYQATGNSTGEQGIAASILQIVLGIMLILLSLRNWRKPVSESNQQPRFFSIVDKITPAKAFSFGAMVTVINFKNLALFLSALSVVIYSPLLIAQKVIITLSVTFVFCLSVIIPVFIYASFPKRANVVLNGIKQTLEKHSRPISIWLPLIFGNLFLIRGLTSLL
jgi:threonine/homoserine/homoserine lactone efflux protein